MAERSNGRGPYTRRTHGSERRGLFPVPSAEAVSYQQAQSRQDKAQLLELIRTQYEARRTKERTEGLGNRALPAFVYKKEIIETLENNRAIILGGETGSGKSTQVPQFLYEAGYDKIFVLVPRRVIADGLGDRIREEMVDQLGEDAANEVGIIHGERVDIHETDRIIVMTPDTFNGMERDIVARHSDQKVAIMSDEIHEANLFTEIATGVAALAVKDNPNWRLIAASATHNASTLLGPFGRINNGEVPVVSIEGRPFNVELSEEPNLTPMEVYASLSEKPDRAMIFTSGKKEIDYIIEQTKDALNKNEPGSSRNVFFRKLHGDLTERELMHVNDPVPEGYKLVIVSSPAGMSGITITGLTHVITDGTINRPELDDDGVAGLTRHYLSKAGIIQQIGRAGRDVAGGTGILAKPITIEEDKLRERNRTVDMPHMPFSSFESRIEHEPAEIYSSNLGRVVLRVAALDRRFNDINEFIPHRVQESSIISAQESLFRLGALDDLDSVTQTGRMMNKFPLSPEISRGLVEAQRGGRSLEYLAHAALIAAAVDVGGLQKFTGTSSEWKKLIRQSTGDDFIAQDDLAMSILKSGYEPESEQERGYFIDYDLHPKKVERARKAARKVLRVLGVNIANLDLVPLRVDEEGQISEDFSAGMIDLVYREIGRRNRTPIYQNIHGDEDATERAISDRSIAKPEKGRLVAAFPRWYSKRDRSGKLQQHHIIEQVLLVDPETIGSHAKDNGLLTGRPLRPRIEGDMVVEQEQKMFGSIEVGAPVASTRQEQISKSSQDVLVAASLNNPGEAQLALRRIADEISGYLQTIPPEDIERYRHQSAPEYITKKGIDDLLRTLAKSTRSLSGLDRGLAHHVYSKGISINRYFDDEARIEMRERSPEFIDISGQQVKIFYEKGVPYITVQSGRSAPVSDTPVYLKDGREVLVQIYRNGQKNRVSFSELS